jgi:hypothetical protein
MAAIVIGDAVLIRPHMGNFYMGKIVSIDKDCISISDASYGDHIPEFLSNPDPTKWSYWEPSVEIMFMTSSLYWIAKAAWFPKIPEGFNGIAI